VVKAIVVYQTQGVPRLVWEDVRQIDFGSEEVLVNVRATAVNRADLAQARGNYPPPAGASEILGLEMAGEIAAAGSAVRGWQLGDRVCALLAGGGYAEQAAVHGDMLLPLPAEWSYAQGAAIPEVWLTAYVNLFLEGGLRPGERVLIHAGGSGVGTAAVQLAHEAGAAVYVTAGSVEKIARCTELGALRGYNYKAVDYLQGVLADTGGEGVDLILDPVGAEFLERNLRALRPNGRLVNIGLLSGGRTTVDLGLILGKSLRVVGSRLRPRPLEEKIAITRGFRERFWPAMVAGKLRPIIDTVFPIADAQSAHDYVRANRNIGKVILTVSAG
jgi:putative PIG3 family NAD(P)H quinone oxidoreductase